MLNKRGAMPYLYSPYPAPAYRLFGTTACETSFILDQGPGAAALWNYFWLSNPDIDKARDAGPAWYKHYRITDGLVEGVYRDVLQDEALSRKLVMHPEAFYDWFERQDHSEFALNRLLGPSWVPTVMFRAALASERELTLNPPVVVTGNVIQVNFRSAA